MECTWTQGLSINVVMSYSMTVLTLYKDFWTSYCRARFLSCYRKVGQLSEGCHRNFCPTKKLSQDKNFQKIFILGHKFSENVCPRTKISENFCPTPCRTKIFRKVSEIFCLRIKIFRKFLSQDKIFYPRIIFCPKIKTKSHPRIRMSQDVIINIGTYRQLATLYPSVSYIVVHAINS